MKDILQEVNRWLESGQSIALATVVQTWGSSPRQAGARMAITRDGKIAGSVSGGCVEGAVVQAGLESLETDKPQLLHFSVADEAAWQVGLACGGTIEVFVKPLEREAFHALQSAIEYGGPVAQVTVIHGHEPMLGKEAVFSPEKRLFGEAGPGSETEMLALVRRAFTDKQSQRHTVKGEHGPVEVFVDALLPAPTLVMVGGVQIAIALTTIAQTLGFRTVIIDPRRTFGNPERFSHAGKLIQAWPEEAFSRFEINEDTAICMLTHDPKIDDPALHIALASPAFYVGALGSRSTQAKRRKRLLESGMSDAQLDRLHAPIGLDIRAETPEEIALSIMAQVVAARRERWPVKNRLTNKEKR